MTEREYDDPFTDWDDGINDVDMNDLSDGAFIIYGSLSNIDVVKTTPEVFWSLFGTPNLKATTVRWLDGAIKKLTEIEQGMPT
jgi:hypothetical protein